MTDALRYEVVRLRSIRSTWWLAGSAVVIAVAVSLLIGITSRVEFDKNGAGTGDVADFGSYLVTQLAATGQVPSLVGFVLAMTGIFAWGHEYRHGMIRASLTALSSRTNFWVAKYLVVGAWVVAVTLLAMLLSGLIGLLLLRDYVQVFEASTWRTMGWQLLATLLLTWLGMAFTSLTRSQAFALVAIFLWPLLVESLVNTLFLLVPALRDHQDLLRFLPFSAQRRMTDVTGNASSLFGDPLSPLGGAVVFGGVTVVLMVVSLALFQRRDA